MAEPVAENDWTDPEAVIVEDAELDHGTSRWDFWSFCLAVVAVLAGVVGLAWHGGLRANLHTEYVNIARALAAGEGFAHPFQGQTGPTAWMAPLLPLFLAGLLVVGDGSPNVVGTTIVVLQVLALGGTGILVLTLARQTTQRLSPLVIAAAFLLGTLAHFRICFQTASADCWLLLIAVDLLLAGLCWAGPFADWKRAAAWGFFGGVVAMISPVIAFAWAVMSVALALRLRAWSRLAVALLVAALTITPWTVRNYLLFGRLIPVKANLAYELYQSQCLQPTGMLHPESFDTHPYQARRPEGLEYRALGETAYLDRKREQFQQAVGANFEDFLNRVADRFLGAALWYEPFNPIVEVRHPWILQLTRVIHPLPFVALLFLVFRGIAADLSWVRWAAIGVYLLNLLPYIAISYYDRYAMPLVGVKVLLVLWAVDELLQAAGQVFESRGSRLLRFSSNPP